MNEAWNLYRKLVTGYLNGEQLSKLTDELPAWGQDLIRVRYLRRENKLNEAETILQSMIVLPELENAIQAEVKDQLGQVTRLTNPQRAAKWFQEAASLFQDLGNRERNLETRINELHCQESSLSGNQRWSKWKDLLDDATEFPSVRASVQSHLAALAQEMNSREGFKIISEAISYFKNNNLIQDYYTAKLIECDLHFHFAQFKSLQDSFQQLKFEFMCRPVEWLRPRMLLAESKLQLLSGQIKRAQFSLETFLHQRIGRARDILEGLVLYLFYVDPSKLDIYEPLLVELIHDPTTLHFQKIQAKVILLNQPRSDLIQEIQTNGYDILLDRLIPQVDPLIIRPCVRGLIINGHERFFKSQSKVFDLLMVMASQPDRAFTKAELYHEVWGQSHFNESTDGNVLHVNLFNLRKIIGKSRILAMGSTFKWNSRISYLIQN